MPTTIIKLPCDGQDYYLEWSSVVDAPVTYGMTLDEFKSYYRAEYGNQGMERLEERMKRVEETGTSDRLSRKPVKEWVKFNRAGDKETQITYDKIVDKYVRKRPQS